MPREDLAKICDDADMIVKGYALKRKGILNKPKPSSEEQLWEVI